jgi:hypothetical protein
VDFGQREDKVPGMPDRATAGLEQPLLQARQRPTLNGKEESEPTQEGAEIVYWVFWKSCG